MPKGKGNTCVSPILLERANEMYCIYHIRCVRPLITCIPSGFQIRITPNHIHIQVRKSRQIGNDCNLLESTNQ